MKTKFDLNKIKEVVGQLKTKQEQLQALMNKETLKEAKKLIQTADVKKVKTLLIKEVGELAKFTKFVDTQRKELEKILKNVNAKDLAGKIRRVKPAAKKNPSTKKAKAVVVPSATPGSSTETVAQE